GGRRFVLVDAGFHTLQRPLLYGAYHRISAPGREGEPTTLQLVAGPLCESADVLTQGKGGAPDPRPLPALDRGDLLVVHDVGAYGASMASCYNSRPLPAEVSIGSDGVPFLSRAPLDATALVASERREA
ncbi:MAG: diaminopimelate decarboxylase, partial [Planctomycetota bacterium]